MTSEIEHAIVVTDLIKNYGEIRAVDGISFSVHKGEIFGFLGPNGAGKTTTIKILTTLLSSSAGNAQMLGININANQTQVRQQLGIVFQDHSLDMDLTGFENLRFHGLLYGMTESEIKERSQFLLTLIELNEWADKPVKKYSGGMKRRLEIIRALLHSPNILFLDEPTLGLDPQSRRKIWDYLRLINIQEQITIFLTTHYMEEADQLCSRVAIIDHGKIVAFDTPQMLKSQVGGDVITIDAGSSAKMLLDAISSEKLGLQIKGEINQDQVILNCTHSDQIIPKLIRLADEMKINVKSVNMKKPGLDDVFFHFTGRQIRTESSENMSMTRMQMKKMMRGGGMKHA